MIANYLTAHQIQFCPSVATWQAAIQLAAQPLLQNQTINSQYIDAIIQNVYTNGNYFILLPEIAMAHARPENGSLKNGMSFLKLTQAVFFPHQTPVKIIFVIAGENNAAHLQLIEALADFFSNATLTEQLLSVSNKKDLLHLIEQF